MKNNIVGGRGSAKSFIRFDNLVYEYRISKLTVALKKIAYSDQCNRCDGCGYDNGCMDKHCALYIARKALENDR